MNNIQPETKKINLPGLAKKMIAKGLLTEAAAIEVMHNATHDNRSFYMQSIEQNSVGVMEACSMASNEFGIPTMELDSINIDLAPVRLIPAKLIDKHHIFPLYLRGSKLFVAVGDPGNNIAMDEVRFNTGLHVSAVLVDPRKLARLLDTVLESEDDVSLDDIVEDDNINDIDLTGEVDEVDQGTIDMAIDTPIVRFVNKILQDAIRLSASDIHIEPFEKVTRIRYRIDGVLHDAINPPMGLIHKITARIKILSRLDIAERRLPQDGRMKITLSRNRTIDFRVSTMPVLFGEKLVIRILDTASSNLGLETIGMEEQQLTAYRRAAAQPHGMILVTGPTGSGKTVSLYSAMNMLNTTERNISSVEDPVEIYVTGINQVNINEKSGLSFSKILRAFLRQDPDVLMVGEIRDLETAEIAIKAAQTGHMVLSTLHTNDAPSSLTRLMNMGVAPFNIASSVSMIIAQRLVRRLCDSCRDPVTYPEDVLLQAGFSEEQLGGGISLFEAVGCSGCTDGYRGRTGIFEAMPMTPALAELVMTRGSTQELEKQARLEGIKTMRQSGLSKVAAGLTTLEEVERVTTD